MDIELLGRQNPWWLDREQIINDPVILEFEESSFKWYPRFLSSLNLKEDLIYIIFGPRQVGKTTSFKLLIKTLLEDQEVEPRSVLYFNCEEITPPTPQRLAELIDGYIAWAQTSLAGGRQYIFIDEATYIKDWERGVKILADRGRLNRVTLFATGSHLMGLRRGGERLPGRRGKGNGLDIAFFPLSFREYLIAHQPLISSKLPAFPGWDTGLILEAVQETSLLGKMISPLFESFLRTGGFPRSIREQSSCGYIKPGVYKIYRDAFIGDLIRIGRKESLFRELVQWIISRRENPFEWSDAARETYVGTHPTIREYIEDAESSFVWDIFYKVKDIGKPFRAPRSPKKVHFKDPFIFHALRAWVLGYQDPYRAEEVFLQDPNNLGYFMENLVGAHLRRVWADNVYYWRNGGEIDFVIFEEGQKKALVELKYQSRVSSHNARVLNKWGGGIILTRDSLLCEENVIHIPLQYFLALLGSK
jgi:hypothetical protein